MTISATQSFTPREQQATAVDTPQQKTTTGQGAAAGGAGAVPTTPSKQSFTPREQQATAVDTPQQKTTTGQGAAAGGAGAVPTTPSNPPPPDVLTLAPTGPREVPPGTGDRISGARDALADFPLSVESILVNLGALLIRARYQNADAIAENIDRQYNEERGKKLADAQKLQDSANNTRDSAIGGVVLTAAGTAISVGSAVEASGEGNRANDLQAESNQVTGRADAANNLAEDSGAAADKLRQQAVAQEGPGAQGRAAALNKRAAEFDDTARRSRQAARGFQNQAQELGRKTRGWQAAAEHTQRMGDAAKGASDGGRGLHENNADAARKGNEAEGKKLEAQGETAAQVADKLKAELERAFKEIDQTAELVAKIDETRGERGQDGLKPFRSNGLRGPARGPHP